MLKSGEKMKLVRNNIPPEIINLIDKGVPLCDLDEIFTLATKRIGKSNSYEVKCMRHDLKRNWVEIVSAYKKQHKGEIKRTYSDEDIEKVRTKLKEEIQKIQSNYKNKDHKNKRPLGGYSGVYFLSSRNKGKSSGKKAYFWLPS